MNTSPPDADRLEELLADRAVFGLDPTEQSELDVLLGARGLLDPYAVDDSVDPAGYDRTAAALFLAAAPVETEAMPTALRSRVMSEARSFEPAVAPGATRRRDWGAGLLFAIAASLMIAFGISLLGVPSSSDPAADRTALLAEADDVVTIPWSDPTDADAAANLGDVVWSDSRQRGYMRFDALPPNDPNTEQYQLWVFDAERDDRYPVDGGVFDIVGDAGAVVAIDAKLPVTRATMFAITIEKPGGVVVSDRSRLPLLAER